MSNKVGFGVEVNASGAVRKLNEISKAFDKLGGKGSGASLFGNVGAKAIAGGFNLIADAMSSVIGFGFDSIEAFSKLEQAAGGLEAVFGDTSKAFEDFAETSATAAGLSKRAVFEMATVLGAKLQGLGFDVQAAADKTLWLEQKGADLAAQFGGSTSDAIAALSSLLTGERDPIERYGVSIKQADINARVLALGLDTSTTAAKKNAEAVAALSLLEEQTATSTGAFSREVDTLAGKQSIANAKLEDTQAVLGEKLAPIMLGFTNFLIDVGIPAIEAVGAAFREVTAAIDANVKALQRGIDKLAEWANLQPNQAPLFFGPGEIFGPPKATGGWVGLNGPEAVITGEHGPEYITPTHQAMGGSGGSHGHDIIMDGKLVARLVDQRMAQTFSLSARTRTAT